MRVLVITHNYPRFSGDFYGSFIQSLCLSLAENGQHVTALFPDDVAYDGRHRDGPVELRCFRYAWPRRAQVIGYGRSVQGDQRLAPTAALLTPAFLVGGTLAALRLGRFDIVHAHWLVPNGIIGALAARRWRVPLVVSIAGADAMIASLTPLTRRLASMVLAQASAVTANSDDLREVAITLGADPARTHLVIYGVDTQRLTPEGPGRWEIRRHLGLTDDALVILGVGRLVPKKGFHLLIQAMPTVLRHVPTAHAVIVGHGEEQERLEGMAQKLGLQDRVHFVGTVPYGELAYWYRMADVFAMPAVRPPADGLNVVVVKALACGLPVVATPAAGNPLVIHHGETGLLVAENDLQALADGLITLLRDREGRTAMGRRARELAVAELSWPAIARRYGQIYQECGCAPR